VEQRGLVPEHLDVPLISSTNGGHPFAGPEPPMINLEGQYRVLVAAVPGDETVVIGCSIAAEATELNQSALVLTLVGLGILLFGLAGGWWIVSQVLRPIVEISQTAEKISSGDLAQRINVAETESELGQLAAVLNSTFARLEGAFAQQQQFTADAAHELRTPVAVIITQTQMALGRDRAAADYKATLEACQRAAQRMRRLIESLLELARFDAGQQHLKRAPFDVAVTAGESLQLVQPLAEQQNVKIISEFSPTPITGDPERIGQVLLNLLTNAIQYNRPGGEVRVSVRTENSMALITVSDTGPGISPEDLPRVTERFYRADQSRSTGGSGLGLSICQAIIAAHGGTLEISSELNRGTTAVLRLPVNKK
jgi:heavy metal sensor kinase